MKKNKAYKFRLYPDKEQRILIAKTFGCCRFIWNYMLSLQKKADELADFRYTLYDMNMMLPKMKKRPETAWLKEVDSSALQSSLKDLDTAFKRWDEIPDTGKPKFKSKHKGYASFRVPNNKNIGVSRKAVKLPKLGFVRARIHRNIPQGYKLKSITVSRDADGRYYAACLFAYEDAVTDVKASYQKALGLDYAADGLCVSSEGVSADMPRYMKKSAKRLAKEQKKLSRKAKSSKNKQKQRSRTAKVYKHVRNQRQDFLQKESTKIANSYDLVAVEDLNLKGIASRKHKKKRQRHGSSTYDNAYGSFVNMLAYKLADRGKHLVKIDRWYPSSQICHACGYQNPVTKDIRVRIVTCPVCGRVYDRDRNAAENIRDEGWRIYQSGILRSA